MRTNYILVHSQFQADSECVSCGDRP